MIRLVNVSKSYNKVKILEHVNITLPNVGIVLIKGKNGSGKTTLLNIISKIVKYKGKVKSDNLNNISYLFQTPHLLEYLTIQEHLRLFNIDDSLLDVVNLRGKMKSYPSELSAGQKQRLAIIISVCSDREIILLDEPFSNLDEENIKLVCDLIEKQSKNKLILIINHHNKVSIKSDVVLNINGNVLKISNHLKKTTKENNSDKKKNNFIFIKKHWSFYKKDFFKLYIFMFLLFSVLTVGLSLKKVMCMVIDKDISYSVDYNKFYIKQCSLLVNKGLKIDECGNPTHSALSSINYGYNYDYLLNHLYSREDLSVMNNKKVILKDGRYPNNEYEVIANQDYSVGDKISLDANLILRNGRVDIYNKEIEVEVVGIYYPLKLSKQDKIYFDYNFIEEYFKKEKFNLNNLSLYNYYKDLDITAYKYLSFEKNNNNNLVYVGEKFDYYYNFSELINKIDDLIMMILLVVIIFWTYNFYRCYKMLLLKQEKDVNFLLVNSFSKLDILSKIYLLTIIPLLLILLVSAILIVTLKCEILFINIKIFSLFLILVFAYTFLFYRRNKIGKSIRSSL